MSLETHASDYAAAAGKASPSIAVTGAAVAGIPLQDWVLMATLAYTVLQIALLVRKYLKERRAERAAAGGHGLPR